MNGKAKKEGLYFATNSWSTYPHLFAYRASGGKWFPYPHLKYISKRIAPKLIQGGGRFIVTLPPRHGKSELISNWLPTWYLYNFPDRKVILTSYAIEFASKWGSKVKENLTENRLIETSLSRDTKAKKRFATLEGGQMITAGIGGPITGEGAQCFIGETKILTSSGEMSIKEIHEAKTKPLILSFNHKTNSIRWSKIIATQVKRAIPNITIESSTSKIQCTPEHPLWNGREYAASSAFRCTDSVYMVPQNIYEEALRLFKSNKKWNEAFLLHKKVPTEPHENKVWKKVSGLQTTCFKENKKILRKLQAICEHEKITDETMPAMFKRIPTHFTSHSNVFAYLCGQAALKENEETKKFKLQAWQRENGSIQENKTTYQATRQSFVSCMQFPEEACGSSHRSKYSQQPSSKSCHPLPCLPYEATQIKEEPISKIETIAVEECEVYDIQVENDHNFFAERILVHNCLIIDDPIKNYEEAMSEKVREGQKEWFQSVARTRLEPNGSILILQTRWHEDDLAGWLIEKEGGQWDVINMPAICEDPQTDLMARPLGAALCPERYNEKDLQDIKKDVGELVWEALYQQNPIAQKGNMIEGAWIKYWDTLPVLDETGIFVDLTYKDGEENDFAVFEVWGRSGSNIYLLDQIRGRMNFTDQLFSFKRIVELHPDAFHKEIEDKANGTALIDMMKNEIPGLIANNPKTSKEARLASIASLYRAGNVYYPNPQTHPWVKVNLQEITRFPKAKHDDTVDVASMAVTHLGRMGSTISRLTALGRW